MTISLSVGCRPGPTNIFKEQLMAGSCKYNHKLSKVSNFVCFMITIPIEASGGMSWNALGLA